MKIITKSGIILSAAVFVLLTAAVTSIAFICPPVVTEKVFFTYILFILAGSIALMAFALKRSLRITLYSYANIGLIAGILFFSVLAVSVGVYFISCFVTKDFSLSHLYEAVAAFPKDFSFYAVFILIAVSVLLGISNIALIRREGFRPRNALSIIFAGFYIGSTVIIFLVSYLLDQYVFIPQGMHRNPDFVMYHTTVDTFILLMLCYFECVLVGCAVMGWLAARQKPAHDKDYIIILGCSIDKKGGLLPLLKGRVNRAIRFAWEQEIDTGKPLRYVPSGGKGPNEIMSEGSAMELYLKVKGAEDDEVFPEKESRNTYENMAFSKKIIDGLKPDAKIAFATTNYHMLRSGIIARQAGIDAEGIAGDTKWYFWPNGFIREFFGILAMEKKAHIITAVFALIVSVIAGIIGFIGILL